MDIIFTVLLFIFVLGSLVLAHEIGHFFAARFFKVAVDEFGVGFPPKLFGKKIGNTEYTINAIPVGGFVRIKGVAGDERGQNNPSTDADSFLIQKRWKKFVILFAGIGMNVVVGALLFTIIFWMGTRVPLESAPSTARVVDTGLTINYVLADSPAFDSHIAIGDTIFSVNDESVATVPQFQELMKKNVGQEVVLQVESQGTKESLTVIPQTITVEDTEIVGIGVGMVETGVAQYGFFSGIKEGVVYTGQVLLAIVLGFVDLLKNIVTPGGDSVGDQVSGPIGIATMTHDFARAGIVSLLQFMAILSLNLAVFNLLPVPMLDGGRIFLLAIETIFRKPVPHKIETIIHQIGFFALFALLIFVTFKDVGRLF